MKVLFLNYEYPPLGAGAANATAYLLAEFAKDPNMEVHLVTSSLTDAVEHIRVGGEVYVHRLPIGKDATRLHSQSIRDILAYSWKAFWFSLRLIRTEKNSDKPFDVTLAFFTVPCGFLAYLFRVLFHLPYLVALRGSDVPGYNLKYSTLYIFLRPLVRLIWKNAAKVIPNSDGLRNLARETAPRQAFEIIANGVDTAQFFPDYSKRPADEVIITPGASRITDRKGLRYLVEALEMLLPKYPKLRLKIMGDGSGRPALEAFVAEKKLQDKVTFIGRVPREETLHYYQEATFFVLPSLNEGMSNAMLEALAAGLPLIATETGGADELVEEGKNGFVVPVRSAEKIKEALEKLLVDPDQIRAFGEESRRQAETRSWAEVARNFQNAFQESQKK